tara:strand:+ start:5477 stop:6511 length:1035 start_codon:yes stop_codon:yes gene_type:complete
MARGGINKRLVKEARDAILAKGQNPSIDTIRIELGNTGSKTTIHRYLKELEESESARLDDEALLSGNIKNLVANLASNLHMEANAIVKEAEERQNNRQREWQEQDAKQKQCISELEKIIEKLKNELANSEKLRFTADKELRTITIENQRIVQEVTDLIALAEEKDKRIQSLEDKHQHARDAAEHYRRAVKEQRDQDQRQHEQQVQLLQTEQRHLSQTLSIKLSEITQLNKENARFVTEISETRKLIPPLDTKITLLEKQLSTALNKNATLTSQKSEQQIFAKRQEEELTEAKKHLVNAIKLQQDLNIEIAKLKSELDVKNEMFDKISTYYAQPVSSPEIAKDSG